MRIFRLMADPIGYFIFDISVAILSETENLLVLF